MKRATNRILVLLLAVFMVVSMIPMAAQAETRETYDLWIGDVQVTDDNLSGTGWAFDPNTSTLTLDGYTSDGTGHNEDVGGLFMVIQGDEFGAIFSKLETLTITLKGSNTVTAADNTYFNPGIMATGALIINGNGSLTVSGGTTTKNYSNEPATAGIMATALTIDVGSGNVSITGGISTKKGHSYGLIVQNDFIVNSGTVSVIGGQSSNWSYGYYGGPVTINGGTATIKGGEGYNSYGLAASALSVYKDELTVGVSNAQNSQRAMGVAKSSCTFGENVTAIFSDNADGSNPVSFEEGNVNTNKYFNAKYYDPGTGYPVYINGKQVTSNIAGDLTVLYGVHGQVSYDPNSNTLTLNGATIEGGNENNSYYGYGICYRGEGTFNIVAKGQNSVSDRSDSMRIYHSFGLVIGEPGGAGGINSTANVNITAEEGAMLVFYGGAVSGTDSFTGSYGICSRSTGDLTIAGSGTVVAQGSYNSRYSYGIKTEGQLIAKEKVNLISRGQDAYGSYGIMATTVTAEDDCSVTAIAGNAGQSISAGIYCVDFNTPEDFVGRVMAAAGNALGTSYYTATYGIRTTGDVDIKGGTVTSSAGSKTGSNTSADYAVGIYGENSLSISGDAAVMSGGEGFGLFCYQGTVSIDSSSVTAIGGNMATNGLELINVSAIASTNTEGSNPVIYKHSAYNTYKFVQTTPIIRLSGSNRYKTAIEAAEHLKKEKGIDKFSNIVLASGLNFPDALSASYLAYMKDGPILLVDSAVVDMVTGYVNENLVPGGKVYIVGGKNAVPLTVDEKIAAVSGEDSVVRLAGTNRYKTNLMVLEEAGVEGKDMLVASGTGFADALSASAAKRPILLVGTSLTDYQKEYLTDNSASLTGQYYVIGGTGAVNQDVYDAVSEFGTVERLKGSNRFTTSIAVANKFFPGEVETVVVANGINFPDGLSGGPIAAYYNAPLILVTDGAYSHATDFWVGKMPGQLVVIGGKGVVSEKTASAIVGLA